MLFIPFHVCVSVGGGHNVEIIWDLLPGPPASQMWGLSLWEAHAMCSQNQEFKNSLTSLSPQASQATLTSGGQERERCCLQPHSMGILWFCGKNTSFWNQTWVPTLTLSLTS